MVSELWMVLASIFWMVLPSSEFWIFSANIFQLLVSISKIIVKYFLTSASTIVEFFEFGVFFSFFGCQGGWWRSLISHYCHCFLIGLHYTADFSSQDHAWGWSGVRSWPKRVRFSSGSRCTLREGLEVLIRNWMQW